MRLFLHQQSLISALIENVQRVDLNPIEIAQALKKMGDELHLDQKAIAERVGKKRSTVSNYIRLLQLPQKMQDAVAKGRLTVAHAKVLLSCTSRGLQDELFQSILKNGTTIKRCIKILQQREKPTHEVDPDRAQLESDLQHILGTKVCIKEGEIVISWYSHDDLERLLSLLQICV